jgi:DNA-binding MarR family transcriptional regulator
VTEPDQATDDALRRIEQELLTLLSRVRRSVAAQARALDPDLQATGLAVLRLVAVQGPVRATEVTRLLDLDKGMVSRQVSRLEAAGLVVREADPEDGRAHLLRLTDEGRTRVEAIVERQRAEFAVRLGSWGGADLTRFADDLARYNASLANEDG